MPLPAHLQKYDRLLDLLAECVARAVLAEVTEKEPEPAATGPGDSTKRRTRHENCEPRAPSRATATLPR